MSENVNLNEKQYDKYWQHLATIISKFSLVFFAQFIKVKANLAIIRLVFFLYNSDNGGSLYAERNFDIVFVYLLLIARVPV